MLTREEDGSFHCANSLSAGQNIQEGGLGASTGPHLQTEKGEIVLQNGDGSPHGRPSWGVQTRISALTRADSRPGKRKPETLERRVMRSFLLALLVTVYSRSCGREE
jgi:hypothetical protein